MAWSNSKAFRQMLADVLGNTTAMDLDSDTIKAALYNNTTTPNQDDRVLLQVVTFTTDVGGDFEAVGQTYTAYFTQCGVWFFRSGGIYTSTYATFLRAGFQRRHVALCNFAYAWFANQLVNCCH